MFMTQPEIKDMTGAVQLKTQKTWCMNNGIEYRTANDGKLRILKDHVLEVFNPKIKAKAKKPAPNWGAMKNRGVSHGQETH